MSTKIGYSDWSRRGLEKIDATFQELMLLEAIRRDPRIGRGSCSSIDEAMEDWEVVERLREENLSTAEEAVAFFVDDENVWRSVADDIIAAGGDDDFRWGQV